MFVLCEEREKVYLRGTFDNIHKNDETIEYEEIEEEDNIIGQPVNAGKCQTVPHKSGKESDGWKEFFEP